MGRQHVMHIKHLLHIMIRHAGIRLDFGTLVLPLPGNRIYKRGVLLSSGGLDTSIATTHAWTLIMAERKRRKRKRISHTIIMVDSRRKQETTDDEPMSQLSVLASYDSPRVYPRSFNDPIQDCSISNPIPFMKRMRANIRPVACRPYAHRPTVPTPHATLYPL